MIKKRDVYKSVMGEMFWLNKKKTKKKKKEKKKKKKKKACCLPGFSVKKLFERIARFYKKAIFLSFATVCF